MNNKPKKTNRFAEFVTGKGFYLVLILCIAAIGVSGYMLIFNNQASNGDSNLSYVDQETALTDSLLDKAVIPEWPQVTASPSPTPGNVTTPTPSEDDIPVAAVTSIPKAATSPLPSATPTSEASATPKPSATPQPEKLTYVWPLKGETFNTFSDSDLVYNKTMGDWRVHLGLDISGELGSQVVAAAAGVVEDVYEDAFWGTTIRIKHTDGMVTQYSNLAKKPPVIKGDAVKSGQVIGSIGTTAEAERRERNHLHFAMTDKNNKPVNPITYLPS